MSQPSKNKFELALKCRRANIVGAKNGTAGKIHRAEILAIVERVAAFYDTPLKVIFGRMRCVAIAWPRQVAMYCARASGANYAAIGKVFKRDHATVIHNCGKVDDLCDVDDVLKSEVEELLKEIKT